MDYPFPSIWLASLGHMPTAGLVTIARVCHAQTGWDLTGPTAGPSASPEAHGSIEEEWLLRVKANKQKDQPLLSDFIKTYLTLLSDFKGLFYSKVQRWLRRGNLS